MKKSLLSKIAAFAVLFILLFTGQLKGQSLTTVFNDDFSTNQSATFTTTGTISSSSWTASRSGNDWGVRRNTATAQLEMTNDVGGTTNTNGWSLATTSSSSFASPYNTILSSNPGLVTWTFNMRQTQTDPGGFTNGLFGVAYIIAGQNTTDNNSGAGYAVCLGQTGTNDAIRLVRYNNGLQGTQTAILSSNTTGLANFGTEYLSIKVTYNPTNNQWELFVRNDGSSAFADPTSGTLTSQGTATNNTSTGTALAIMGAYWQGGTTATQTAFFNNTKVVVSTPPALVTTPTSLAYGAVASGSNSVSQSFNLSATNLGGFPADITVTAPSQFQVSNDNATWGTTTTIGYTSATLSATPVYVRFSPTSTGAKSGNVSFSVTGGVSYPTVALTGTGVSNKTWAGGASGNWNTAGSWSPSGVPATGDIVIFNTPSVIAVAVNVAPATLSSMIFSANTIVTLTSSGGARSIVLTNPGNTALEIQTGSNVILNGSSGSGTRSMNINFTGTGNISTINGTLSVTNVLEGSSYDATNTITTVNGTLINDGSSSGTTGTITSTASNLFIAAGGIYQHALNGGDIPTATWNATSNCVVTGTTNTLPTVGSFAQSFGNLTWNCSGQTIDISLIGNLLNVNNFTMIATNTGSLRLSNSGVTDTFSIAGNYEQTGGTFYFSGSGVNTWTVNVAGNFAISGGTLNMSGGGGNATLNLKGDYTMSGGTLTQTSGTSLVNFNGTTTQTYSKTAGTNSAAINLSIAAGATVDFGTSLWNGSTGTFILNTSGKIITANNAGLTSTGATGTIQSTGTRTYNTGASYEFQGSNTGAFTLSTPNTITGTLTFNRSAGITADQNFTATTLALTSGIVTTGSNAITVASGGTYTGGSSTAYVSGIFKRIFPSATTLVFPIGKGGNYRPVSFQYTALTGTSTVTMEQIETAIVGTLPGGVNLNNARTWNISQTGGTGIGYKVTLDGTGDAVAGTVVMLKKDGVGVISSNVATTPNYTNSTAFTTISTPTYVTLASTCSVTANAGPDQITAATCGLTTVTLAGNTPVYGSGLWTVVSGTGGSFGAAASATSTFTGTAGTAYNLQWTLTNGSCNSNDQVLVTLNAAPTTATNGSAATICSTGNKVLSGNSPSVGTGGWSVVSGPSTSTAQFSSLTSPTATFTPAGGAGSYVVRWSISNSPCSASTADATIVVNAAPSAATNGSAATICSTGNKVLSGNSPAVGTGGWSVVSGPSTSTAQFSSLTSPTATFTPAGGAGSYVVRWSISNSPCTASTADATIVVNGAPTTATNTSTQGVCAGSSAALSGNTPIVGTGAWSIVSGPSTLTSQFSSLSNPAATFTPVGGAGTYVIRWTISSAPCTASTADATLTFGTTKTWSGTSWSPSAPTSVDAAVISGNYTTSPTNGNITACNLTVNASAIVLVTSGYDITLEGALTVSSGSFTLEDNANLIQHSGAANSGNIIVKRNSSALLRQDYTLWSSPVASQNLLAFSAATLPNRFYTYNSGTDNYASIVPSTNAFTIGQGYLIRMPNTHPAVATVWNGQFSGVPNNGNVPFAMSNTYNLVGNPYPSPISMSTFVSENSSSITGTLYFWRETNLNTSNNAYCSWAGGTFTSNGEAQVYDPSGIIQTGQGFFVAAKSGMTALNFNNTQRVSDHGDQFFRLNNNEERNTIWLNATNTAGAFSQMAVGYITDATMGTDIYDGKAFADGDMALGSILDNSDYVIQGRALPFESTDVVPLSFRSVVAGDYTIAIDHMIGLFATTNQNVYIKDNLMNITHDLKASAYTFATVGGAFNDRFELVYDNLLAVTQPLFTSNSVVVYKSHQDLVINTGSLIMKEVQVFDIRGRLLATQTNVNATQLKIAMDDTNEVLVVKITSDKNEIVTKKVVN